MKQKKRDSTESIFTFSLVILINCFTFFLFVVIPLQLHQNIVHSCGEITRQSLASLQTKFALSPSDKSLCIRAFFSYVIFAMITRITRHLFEDFIFSTFFSQVNWGCWLCLRSKLIWSLHFIIVVELKYVRWFFFHNFSVMNRFEIEIVNRHCRTLLISIFNSTDLDLIDRLFCETTRPHLV